MLHVSCARARREVLYECILMPRSAPFHIAGVYCCMRCALAGLVILTASCLFGNPYGSIATRNVFHLKEPPPQVQPVQPVTPRLAPNLVLTGVADFSTVKWAFITRTDPGRPAANYTLSPGETEGGLQLLDLNATAATVTVRVDGLETVTLRLTTPTNRPPPTLSPTGARPPAFSRVR